MADVRVMSLTHFTLPEVEFRPDTVPAERDADVEVPKDSTADVIWRGVEWRRRVGTDLVVILIFISVLWHEISSL